jgi:hypothetical protein
MLKERILLGFNRYIFNETRGRCHIRSWISEGNYATSSRDALLISSHPKFMERAHVK